MQFAPNIVILETYLKYRPSCDKVDLVEISDDATKYINPCICLDGQEDGKIAIII
jgi:hypothetical protein